MREKGFTLIELMVVVVILGVLAVIAIPAYINYVHKSRSAEATVNINGIRTLEESYFAENNTYITSLTVIACCVNAPAATLAGTAGKQTRNWTGPEVINWSLLGFAPSGASTYYTYGVNSACPAVVAGVCPNARLTIGAEGNLDGDAVYHTFALSTGTGTVIDATAGFQTNITPAAFGTITEGGTGVF